MPTEVEIKLALAGSEEYQRLLDRLGEAREVIRQHNVFFDGPDGELRRARVTLRLREEKVYRADIDAPHEIRTVLTLKGAGSVEGDVHARAEYEVLRKMIQDQTIQYINVLYAEFHYDKIGMAQEDHDALIAELTKCGIEIRFWDALHDHIVCS